MVIGELVARCAEARAPVLQVLGLYKIKPDSGFKIECRRKIYLEEPVGQAPVGTCIDKLQCTVQQVGGPGVCPCFKL